MKYVNWTMIVSVVIALLLFGLIAGVLGKKTT